LDDAPPPEAQELEAALRWRLVLGRYAEDNLGFDRLGQCCRAVGEGEGAAGEAAGSGLRGLLDEGRTLDAPLNYIYDRAYAQRAHRAVGTGGSAGLSVPMWLSQVRELFPREAVQVLEQDALTRFGMTELVTDPEVLRRATPSEELLKAILQFKHLMNPEVLKAAKEVVREVVDKLREDLLKDCTAALHGVNDPEERPPQRTFRNTDWRKTVRRNLKHWDAERDRLVVERIYYRHRQRMKPGWRIIVSVDQSGSMLDKLLHSAVMAAIFTSLPAVSVHLVLWDTRIVDYTHIAHDPLEVMMSAQLGGGNDDQAALEYCAALITEPAKTILITISDWYICVPPKPLLALAQELHAAGVRCIGLSALDTDCRPVYNEEVARDLAAAGWYVAALTPRQLAERVGRLLA
jgi:hypothetical protein